MSAKTAGAQRTPLADGHQDYAGGKANDIVYSGCIVMMDSSGRAINGAAATGCFGVGVAKTNNGTDRFDSTGLADGVTKVKWEEGVFGPFANSGVAPFLSSDPAGLIVYIEDNNTASKTDQTSTLSPAGFFHHLDAEGVWIDMGKTLGALAKDMVTVTDAAAAHLAGAETFTGVKDFSAAGSTAGDPTYSREANHTLKVRDTTTAATVGGNLAMAAGKSGTSGAGGAWSGKGGAGDTTGAGGTAAVAGGAGGSASGTGGAASLTGGAGTAGNATGGAVNIDGGAKNGSGADGLIGIGLNSGSFAKLGVKVQKAATSDLITDPGNAGAIAVTADGVCSITTAGAETRTLAIPTYVGQRLCIAMDVDGGDAVVTVASAYNQAGNTIITLNDAGDSINLIGALTAGTRVWRIVNNDGCTLS